MQTVIIRQSISFSYGIPVSPKKTSEGFSILGYKGYIQERFFIKSAQNSKNGIPIPNSFWNRMRDGFLLMTTRLDLERVHTNAQRASFGIFSAELRCSSVKYSKYSPSSRLVLQKICSKSAHFG